MPRNCCNKHVMARLRAVAGAALLQPRMADMLTQPAPAGALTKAPDVAGPHATPQPAVDQTETCGRVNFEQPRAVSARSRYQTLRKLTIKCPAAAPTKASTWFRELLHDHVVGNSALKAVASAAISSVVRGLRSTSRSSFWAAATGAPAPPAAAAAPVLVPPLSDLASSWLREGGGVVPCRWGQGCCRALGQRRPPDIMIHVVLNKTCVRRLALHPLEFMFLLFASSLTAECHALHRLPVHPHPFPPPRIMVPGR
jgi:hypothetical protein